MSGNKSPAYKLDTAKVTCFFAAFVLFSVIALSGCSEIDESQNADAHKMNFASVMGEGAQHSAILRSFFDGKNPIASYEKFKKKFPNCCRYLTDAAYSSPNRIESTQDKIFDKFMSNFISLSYIYIIDVREENYAIIERCNLNNYCEDL